MRRMPWIAAVMMSVIVAESVLEAQMPPKPAVVVSPDHADGVYRVGDTVHWTAKWQGNDAPPADAKFILRSGGQKEVGGGPLKFENGVASFESTFTEPNTMLAVVKFGDGPGRQATGGAVAEPFQIQPAAEEPGDFDAFWQSKLAELKAISLEAKLTEADSGNPAVSYAKITLPNINGTHVQGQIARPKEGEKFPAILVPQWAGVYALQKPWVVDHAKNGWLAMNIQAHDIPIDNPPDYYQKLYGPGGELQNYWKIGNTDKNTTYYVRMYLGMAQSIAYLKTRPDWDGKTIVLMGGSQGGQQALVGAALCPDDVTAVLAFQPAACDNWAENIGRRSGFPTWWNQIDNRDASAVHETSKYFDPVYFARRIKCPVLSACGLRDELAAPSSVLAMFNQIRSPKRLVLLPNAGHYDEGRSHAPYHKVVNTEWLPALKKGETPKTD